MLYMYLVCDKIYCFLQKMFIFSFEWLFTRFFKVPFALRAKNNTRKLFEKFISLVGLSTATPLFN